jgi:hypothetical protein
MKGEVLHMHSKPLLAIHADCTMRLSSVTSNYDSMMFSGLEVFLVCIDEVVKPVTLL